MGKVEEAMGPVAVVVDAAEVAVVIGPVAMVVEVAQAAVQFCGKS